jgi:hypothetical protein
MPFNFRGCSKSPEAYSRGPQKVLLTFWGGIDVSQLDVIIGRDDQSLSLL